jgi:hypothetical protein
MNLNYYHKNNEKVKYNQFPKIDIAFHNILISAFFCDFLIAYSRIYAMQGNLKKRK